MEGMNWNADNAQILNTVVNPLIEGYGEKSARDLEAKQLKRKANAITAKGTREAEEQRRRGKVMASNARAQMAGSGASASDAGAIEHLGNVEHLTKYNSLNALFEAETDAGAEKLAARSSEYQGRRARNQGGVKSLATVLKDADKIFGD